MKQGEKTGGWGAVRSWRNSLRGTIGLGVVSAIVVGALAVPAAAQTDPVVAWSQTTSSLTSSARTHTMVHIAIHDALNAVERRYEPYAYDGAAPAGTSAEAAVAAAAHGVLHAVSQPSQRPQIDQAYANALAPIPDGEAKSNGVDVGAAAAEAIVTRRTGDGFGSAPLDPGSNAPGKWRPTSPFPPGGIGTDQARATLFVLEARDQFAIKPPLDLTSKKYARELEEVRIIGARDSSVRTEEQTLIARSWGVSGTTLAAQWLRAVAAERGTDTWETGRMFATALTAATDAVISTFHYKYHYDFWRPITAIREADVDGNPATVADPAWVSLLDAPPFPEWPSAHCTASGAVTEVLKRTFADEEDGDDEDVSFTFTSPALPGYERRIPSLKQLNEDCIDARVWAGVHFRSGDEVGVSLGRQVARFVDRNAFAPAYVSSR